MGYFVFVSVCVCFFMVACLTLATSLNVLIFVGLYAAVSANVCALSVHAEVLCSRLLLPNLHDPSTLSGDISGDNNRALFRPLIYEPQRFRWRYTPGCGSAHKSHGLARPAEQETGCDVNHGVFFSPSDISSRNPCINV